MIHTDHPVSQEELMAYLDGEVTADRAAVIGDHLKGCVDCAALAEDFRHVSRRLMEWEVEASKVRPIEGAPKKVVRWRRPVWAAGLVAAGLLVVVGVTRYEGQHKGLSLDRTSGLIGLGYVGPATPQPAMAPIPMQAVDGRGVGVTVTPTLRSEGYTEQTGDITLVMIAHTAAITLVTIDFAHTRERLDAILKAHHGYMGQLTVNAPTGAGRTLDAALKVPSAELDASLTELKKLGRVESESQAGEEVTQQYVDLEARLNNARNTEQRLTTVLRQKADKMTDVLAVEKEIARVRGEIEQMEAERKNLSARVAFATINVKVSEEYKAQLQGPPSVGTRLANAAVAGYRNVTGGILGLAEVTLEYGFSLVLWAVLLFFPARFLWRRYRAAR